MENAQTPYTPPALGTVRVETRRCDNGDFFALVMVYKANTLRGDAYWVTKRAKKFKKEVDAVRWVNRFAV